MSPPISDIKSVLREGLRNEERRRRRRRTWLGGGPERNNRERENWKEEEGEGRRRMDGQAPQDFRGLVRSPTMGEDPKIDYYIIDEML